MNRLLHSNLLRLKKEISFWGSAILLLLYSAAAAFNQYSVMKKYNFAIELDLQVFTFLIPLILVMPVFYSLFIGTEYSDGTIRNKLVVGNKRQHIYLASFFTCMLSGIFLYLITFLFTCIIGTPLFGFLIRTPAQFLPFFADGLLLCIASSSIYNMIAYTNCNKTHTAIICILTAFGMLFLSNMLLQCLTQPEMSEQAAIVNGELVYQTVTNPYYLTGIRREIYQFICDFLPSGQAIQLSALGTVNLLRMGICSVVIIILTNLLGLFLFRRKDIK